MQVSMQVSNSMYAYMPMCIYRYVSTQIKCFVTLACGKLLSNDSSLYIIYQNWKQVYIPK